MQEEQLHEKLFEELRELKGELKDNTTLTQSGFKVVNGRLNKVEIAQARMDERFKLQKGIRPSNKVIGVIGAVVVALITSLGLIVVEIIRLLAR